MPDEEGPRIIVDEDWKAKVEREKEEVQQQAEQDEEQDDQEPRPFDELVSYLVTHAMGAMGMFAPRDAQEVPVNLDLARFIINSMVALRDKTKGNLTREEEGALKNVIADLQQAFVSCSEAVQETALRRSTAPSPPDRPSGIIRP